MNDALLAAQEITSGASGIPNVNGTFPQAHRDVVVGFGGIGAAEQDRPDVAAARKAFRKEQKLLDPKQLVFIDETAATTKISMAGLCKASGSLIRCHTATGKQRLLYAGCAMMASRPRLWWMARWMDPTSWPMSNRSLVQL